ncbi:MAG: undecaprenyl-diphosphate phosphatase [Firmicutes bacterium]|nr:undecaprenyl-diphosphate phosphatase [Bacillota bacterium]
MGFIEIIKAIIYGIVEGITEWLPVSSTGHLILLNDIMPMKVSPEFWSMFLVIIQLGAIVAVVVYFWNKIWPFNTTVKDKPFIRYDVLNLWCKIIVACIPAAVVGILFDDWIDEHLYNSVVVAIMLISVGVAFIFVEEKNKGYTPRVTSLRQLTFKDALIIGLFQLVSAVLPGTSRSGSTIIGGLLIGVDRKTAAEFTFCMAVPVMAGASLIKILKFGSSLGFMEFVILMIGCVVAFLVSYVCIKFLMDFVKKHDFKIFGYYRIALGIIVLLYFFLLKK